MRKILILILLSFTLQACVSQADFGDAITEGEPTPIPTEIIPSRQIFTVERGDIIYQQTYFGRVSAITTRILNFEQDGRVLETFFADGDDVLAGDVLATLDTSVLETQLLDAEEELAIAESLLQSAQNQIDFARRRAELNYDLAEIFLEFATNQAEDEPSDDNDLLVRQREVELELAQLALDELDDGVNPELQFDVARAQEVVDGINARIAQTQLTAPMDGQLTTFSIDAGDTVTAFEAVGVIADLSALEVTDVLERSQLSELTEGMPVVLQQANRPGETFAATIAFLPQPFGSGNDEAIHIRFDTTPNEGEFSLGDRMSFSVTIDERNDVLWLPPTAIRQFSGRNFIVVQDGGLQQRVDVSLGLESDNRVEILEGVELGQMVIAP